MRARVGIVVGVLTFMLVAVPAHAATPLEVSGWLPYWRTASSTRDATAHLSQLTEINPFGYSVKNDGTLADTAGLTNEPWVSLIAAAKAQKVRVVPTVMWSNGAAIHQILSRQSSRIALEDAIAKLVKDNNFDGIDIDFEGKRAETKDYFSTFLKGLYQRMGTKWVMCDIEPRTPVTSRYDGTPPADATVYANDYAQIGKYCDRVRIMAYDQGSIDLKLNAQAANTPYVPVADPQWVYKVVNLVLQSIPAKKVELGVATYGYEYQVTPLSQSGYRYDLLWAFDPQYALNLVSQYQTSVTRNRAGELSFTYLPNVFPSSPPSGTDATTLLNNTPLSATSYSDGSSATGAPASTFNIVWWSDAHAIADKIAIAKELGLRGVSIFKLDGGEDQTIWNILPTRGQ